MSNMYTKNYNGADLGDDFKRFYNKVKRVIVAELRDANCTNLQMSRQFYYFAGFFTAADGQVYYFSCSDVRWFVFTHLMVRAAKHYGDYEGSINHYVRLRSLAQWTLARASQVEA